MTIFAETAEGLQIGLDILESYCNRWKVTVNIEKTKIMVFRKGGILPRDMRFFYNNQEIEIVKSFSYLGIVFTPGGSFSNAQTTLAGQAQKAVFKLNNYLYSFADLAPRHVLDLFDKLVSPILSYCSEVWGFCKADKIERVHLQYLDVITIRKFRTAMTKLRVSSHRLEVETGRLSRPVSKPFDERKCHICNKLEDEFHFFFSVLYILI